MKILVVHNAYLLRGGEDAVVESECNLLRSNGHLVYFLGRDNREIQHYSDLRLGAKTIWSMSTNRQVKSILFDLKPDIVHVHNFFPLISPSLFWACTSFGIPVIQTLHNFRLQCPQAMFLRNGRVCEDCLGRIPWRGVTRKCYRGSILQSGVLASMIGVHMLLGTWQSKVTRYIALNEFCRSKFIEGGMPAERIVIKPNFVEFSKPPNSPRSGFLFVGRLAAEKGVQTLVGALSLDPALSLRVAGDGPMASALTGLSGVTALGALSLESVRHEMTGAVALVLPSIWYENLPRTLVEAYACGLPIIASNIGALPELVSHEETGLLFEAGNPVALSAAMQWATDNPEAMIRMGENARARYEAEFTPERNYKQLMTIYESAIDEVRRKGSE